MQRVLLLACLAALMVMMMTRGVEGSPKTYLVETADQAVDGRRAGDLGDSVKGNITIFNGLITVFYKLFKLSFQHFLHGVPDKSALNKFLSFRKAPQKFFF